MAYITSICILYIYVKVHFNVPFRLCHLKNEIQTFHKAIAVITETQRGN